MELKKEILIDNRIFEFVKAYPSFVLYRMKDFENIKTCILWQDIYKDPISYNQDINRKKGKLYSKW